MYRAHIIDMYRQSPVKSPDIKNIIVVMHTFFTKSSPLHGSNLYKIKSSQFILKEKEVVMNTLTEQDKLKTTNKLRQ